MVQIVNASEKELTDYIKNQKKRIYVWGSGVMTQVCLQDMLIHNRLTEFVVSCTESDAGKIGKYVLIGDTQIPVVSFETMVEEVSRHKNALIMIACSYYRQILQKLDAEPLLEKVECVCLPMMYLEHLSLEESEDLANAKKTGIPKKIHYCWFGGEELSQKNLACIDSWQKMCPDYEIIRWDESNIDLHLSPWVERAYEQKQWAYVSDYVRAYVLYHFGGYYFDVDVELVKGLDAFSGLEGFGCFEKWPVINTGGGCGSIPKFWIWKEIMEIKDKAEAYKSGRTIPSASGYYDTLPLLKRGMRANGKMQKIDGFVCLPFDYFHPIDYVTRKRQITEHTHGIHYFNWSWANDAMREGNPMEQEYYAESLGRAVDLNRLCREG